MKKTLILLLTLTPLFSFAREPRATLCDNKQIQRAALGFIGLNVTPRDLKLVKIRKVTLTDMFYDLNENEITKNTVKWGYKRGEMAGDTYSLELTLSSSTLDITGNCRILSATQSEIVE